MTDPLTAEAIYLRLGSLIADAPDLKADPTPDTRRWLARVFTMIGSVIACLMVPIMAHGQELKYPPKPYPEVDGNTVVLIEIWPTVGDITFHAYFMDTPPARNLNLCLAGKSVFDRDAEAMAKAQNRTATSYRQCLTLPQAVSKSYITSPTLRQTR
ncbi:hypothetical protein ABIF65_006804 [Bradyrhizobium japonicum]|jgi:hypothetical protein|uniref:hypothetical protein n=1 Tax=Bradyrhizobium TaxID=374 RepID=UPI0004B7E671|nr:MULTISPECIES: hypothetical protein [Bradyrhizobium]WLB99383.1 hypothetical protein QIH92_08010 [Bradyrhizobium japonicum USDA 123]MBR0879476.1 hypothetical protein [Bradyrhizobium liaoningense]MBR0947767.1 hypothetical protein [Bradyrhizobium liaoningense]MBR0999476.1 hypothetical protein [Bradyrhizobium liaoningense]MBR1032942.1 hypothetical protein [Bradyrhizobium liaoningense]